MTLTDERPAVATATTPLPRRPGVVATSRLASRLAWREVRRRKARSALVILLIAVPSAVLLLASAAYRTDKLINTSYDEHGAADLVLRSADPNPIAPGILPDGSEVSTSLSSWGRVTFAESTPGTDADPGLSIMLSTLRAVSVNTEALIEVTNGRLPVSADEVLLPPETAERFGLAVGDSFSLVRPSGTWTLAGTGRWAPDFNGEMWLFGDFDPNRLTDDNRSYVTLVFLPETTTAAQTRALASQLEASAPLLPEASSYEPSEAQPAELVLGWLVGAIGFLGFGIVIAAAFATSARQQLTTIGQLAANGAPPKLIRRALGWQGLWSGLIGGVVGAATALIGLTAILNWAELNYFGRRINGWVIDRGDVVAVIATATLCGLIAATIPARSLTRTSILAALAGRRPGRPVPKWLAPLGLLLAAGGTGLATLALLAQVGRDSAVLTSAAFVGVAAIAVGICCLSPAVIEQCGRLAPRLPLAARLSLRGLARARGRAASVVAAIAVTVAIATVGVAGMERNVANAGSTYPTNMAALAAHDGLTVADALAQLEAAGAADAEGTIDIDAASRVDVDVAAPHDKELPPEALAQIRRAFPAATISTIREAAHPGGEVRLPNGEPWDVAIRLTIADEATMDMGGWPASARSVLAESGFGQIVEASSDEIAPLDRPETALLNLGLGHPGQIGTPETFEFGSVYRTLVTEDAARAHGLAIVDAGVIITNPDPLTVAQRDELEHVLSALSPGRPESGFVEPGDPPAVAESADEPSPSSWWQTRYEYVDESDAEALWIARLVAFAAALAITILVVAIGLALAASDQRDDRRVFVATGTKPTMMGRMAATDALTMTLIGLVIGVPLGFIPAWFVVSTVGEASDGLPFPWSFVVTSLAIIPISVYALAWLGTTLSTRHRRGTA